MYSIMNPPRETPMILPAYSNKPVQMMHDTGFSVDWSPEEQKQLENGLVKYDSQPFLERCTMIAGMFPKKNARCVAARCVWTTNKKNNIKKRKRDDNGYGKYHGDDKEIVVASTSAQTTFAPSPSTYEPSFNGELLKLNEELLSQITKNLNNFEINENIILFNHSRQIISILVNNLNENVPEAMSRMPPLPRVSDELLDTIICPWNMELLS